MNVLVYSGPQVVPSSLVNTLSSLKQILLPHRTVQEVPDTSLSGQPWTISCALLVFPQCATPLARSSVNAIRSFVEGGGSLLALGTGARQTTAEPVDCARVTRVDPTSAIDPLSFFISRTSSASVSSSSESLDVRLITGDVVYAIRQFGLRDFNAFEGVKDVVPLARYENNGSIAGLVSCIWKGKTALWGPNIECPLEDPKKDAHRLQLLNHSLELLGLHFPPCEQRHVKPLPQYLTSTPSKPMIVLQIMQSLMKMCVGGKEKSISLHDAHDDFLFQLHSEPSLSTPDVDAAMDSKIKRILVYDDGTLPPEASTPHFNIPLFYKSLGSSNSKPWGIGEALLYGEVVTSTQTMLDKNPGLLSHLALSAPLLSLATHQISGRGRGSNMWLSPPGCLQFSLLLHISLTDAGISASKLVFVQYLFALAVVEACRDEEVLGDHLGKHVRLKWPNDIYALMGPEHEEKRKVGGILVSNSFSGKSVDIVIGCGLNLFNSAPIPSLSQLQDADARALSMERTAAKIMCAFAPMWDTFVRDRGSFTAFMDLYLDRWLHSDQLVTLNTTNPPTAVRIAGITPDFGLLRTVPVRSGWAPVREGEFIDLQPDGNSFDLMAGMIRVKSGSSAR